MNPDALVAHWQSQQQQVDQVEQTEKDETKANFQAIVDEIEASNKKLVSFLLEHKPEVSVANFPTPEKFPEIQLDTQPIVEAVKGLETALKPEAQDDSGIINAINTLKSQNDALLSVVRQLELRPNITVPEPKVTVQKPDLSPITKAIKANKPEATDLAPLLEKLDAQQKQLNEVVKALTALPKKMPIPVAPNVPTDPLIYYLPADIDDAGTVQYFGFTDRMGAWYIKKLDSSVSPKTIRMCFGQSDYATNWANRSSLGYAVWGQ